MIKTIGIIGGGQLGRMLAMAAARLNFRIVVLEPQANCPAAQVANQQIVAPYDDPSALAELARMADVVTYEFENVPVQSVEILSKNLAVYPPAQALEAAQDRLVEKHFLNNCAIPTARFHAVDSQAELEEALADFGGQGVLKTRRLGYDGKGQKVYRSPADSPAGDYMALGGVPLILESFVPFAYEISMIAARGQDGQVVCFDPARNVHHHGILHTSTVPAGISAQTASNARQVAETILNRLGYVGVIGIEFFVMENGDLIANEMAPRVHNSGHWTEAACTVSQFEQHIRAITGLPLGDGTRHSDCVMQNLIGDGVNDLVAWLQRPDTLVHLYGKSEPRPGRKMGHVTRISAHDNGL